MPLQSYKQLNMVIINNNVIIMLAMLLHVKSVLRTIMYIMLIIYA